MAEHSSFFNSINHDRKYKAEDWAEYFSSFITNGVFPNPSTNLQVMATGNDMRVFVSAGKAWINGYCYYNDSPLYIALANADGATNRLDRIVIRLYTADRKIAVAVKQGAFATSPAAQSLEQDADYYELALADIYVGAGATLIAQANITDQRMNTLLCGWVNSLIQADTTAIFTQYQAWYTAQTAKYTGNITALESVFQDQFDEWFTAMKNQLSSDAAGNLQKEIDRNSLFNDNVKGTVAYPTIANGQVTRIDHKSGDTVVRSDVFTYTTDPATNKITLITEVRTLNTTGDILTLKYHTDTLEVEVS